VLTRDKRLIKNRDFDRAYQKGKRCFSESFNLIFLPNRSSVTRIGIVVGKKFSKKAVERNRAKRVFREAIRPLYPHIKPGYDIVIFAKKPRGYSLGVETMKKALQETIKKAGILK
jgi:ribonuclease P protein component